MAIKRVGPFDTKNVKALITRIQEDRTLRKEAVAQINGSLYAFVEEAFELTPEQRKEMRHKMPNEVAPVVAHALVTALQNGWPIDFRITRERRIKEKPNMRAEIYCRGGDGFECGVRITWEK